MIPAFVDDVDDFPEDVPSAKWGIAGMQQQLETSGNGATQILSLDQIRWSGEHGGHGSFSLPDSFWTHHFSLPASRSNLLPTEPHMARIIPLSDHQHGDSPCVFK